MGTRASKIVNQPVVCPETYNKDDFQKILTLFDKLDQDGNFGLENEELEEISNLHIENLKKAAEISIQDNIARWEKVVKIIDNQNACHLKHLKAKYDGEIKYTNALYKKRQDNYNKYLKTLEKMSEEEKINSFRVKVVNKDNIIEFWKFFEYMKDRVHDIDNIKYN